MQVVHVMTNPNEQLNMKEGMLDQSGNKQKESSFHSLLQTTEQHAEEQFVKGNVNLPLPNSQHFIFNPTVNEEPDENLAMNEALAIHDAIEKMTDDLTLSKDEDGMFVSTLNEQHVESKLSMNEALVMDNDVIDTEEIQVSSEQELNNAVIQQEVIPMIDTIKSLLTGSKADVDLKEVASRLLPILEKWTVAKQLVSKDELEQTLESKLNQEQLSILKFLESNFEKRNYYAEQYRQDASVTRTDMMNWLQSALERYADFDQAQQGQVLTQAATTQQTLPMSEIQQHTIHIQSVDRVDRVSEELTQKLATIIKESRFLTKPSHLQQMNQLTVVLRPEHLGNITVRFQQVEGNMTVNMIVTSQATKELLETNIHQLKHMFSPHQVNIERDTAVSDEDFFEEEHDNQEKEEREDLEQSNNSGSQGNDKDSAFDFQSFIEQFTKEVNT